MPIVATGEGQELPESFESINPPRRCRTPPDPLPDRHTSGKPVKARYFQYPGCLPTTQQVIEVVGSAVLVIRTEMAGVESIHPLEPAMRTQEETEALVEHLEIVLRRLACGNLEPPGSCCACLQDVDTRGHLPSCDIHMALIAIEEWRGIGHASRRTRQAPATGTRRPRDRPSLGREWQAQRLVDPVGGQSQR